LTFAWLVEFGKSLAVGGRKEKKEQKTEKKYREQQQKKGRVF
jgi:hypothetical protein